MTNPGRAQIDPPAAGLPQLALEATRPAMNLPESHPKGVYFRPLFYTPFYSFFQDELCQGVQVYLDPRTTDNLVQINFKIMEAVGAPELFAQATKTQIRSFDITCGSAEPRKYLTDLRDLKPLFAKWEKQCEAFRGQRKPYLLYD